MIRRDADSSGYHRALGVAMVRAWENDSAHPLFTDPYARLLVEAAGAAAPEGRPCAGADYAAARTKWFDDFMLSASAGGVSQVVVLGAGLDTRAWRLPWLSDTVIFEVDEPTMLDLKTATMDASAAQLGAKYMPVPVESGDDWPGALRAAGFDHQEPTAWAIEGVFGELSAEEQDALLSEIALYSARGSRIAVEAAANPDVAQWLCCNRWEASSVDVRDVMHRYHRDTDGDVTIPPYVFVEAKLL
ncbi:SAM-dependent methyltransferase [Mycolicibacterium rufum]|uniref:S-adenosyl-L-methionine-dependent methyltransferase n=1 Tax=Mycolicibacterium rufum TaxID=318424 RepID=A0A9X3BI14_9MYCO|nr:SAM-dependent methyltransferase [Mycolicibacterium rufum]KGI66620.1 SAM-dependent methyltransferase [Mycolicibacterium rufum]MCV7072203.1 SAM-dependent methyltransferase [Mycolicibacterium rufum]ULP37399.1 SAM-dependent methyltransferase [Mycolicibacterium rufum]